jgi:hypothetical protein
MPHGRPEIVTVRAATWRICDFQRPSSPDQTSAIAPRLSVGIFVRRHPPAVPAIHLEITLPMDLSMNIYPANEQRIWEVERGRSFSAILPLNEGKPLSAGDSILFALSISHGNQEPAFVKGGDSVRVTDLEKTDPVTGEALFQITWERLGQDGSPTTTSKRGARSR